MKNLLSIAALLASMLIFNSCNEKAKLADSIAGSWSGQAERVDVPGAKTTTTVTRSFTFTPDLNSSTGGEVIATAQFSVESGTQLEAAGTQPIAVTVGGTATIKGHWEALDDDDVMVAFDQQTFQVTVDPNEVVLEYNIATEESTPVDETASAQVIEAVTRTVTPLLKQRVFNYTKIKDIKVNENLLSCELEHKDYTFHREE